LPLECGALLGHDFSCKFGADVGELIEVRLPKQSRVVPVVAAEVRQLRAFREEARDW
jgi:hypothetical protein